MPDETDDRYSRYTQHHARWAAYYAIAAVLAAVCAGVTFARGVYWAWALLSVLSWRFIVRGVKHRRLAEIRI